MVHYALRRANVRATEQSSLEIHLRREPAKTSRSRIKRPRGFRGPQLQLQVGETLVFYAIPSSTVEILAIMIKSEAEAWLRQFEVRV
jgi:hypothetical protein